MIFICLETLYEAAWLLFTDAMIWWSWRKLSNIVLFWQRWKKKSYFSLGFSQDAAHDLFSTVAKECSRFLVMAMQLFVFYYRCHTGVFFKFALFSVSAFSPSCRKDPLRNQRANVLSWKVGSSYNSFPVTVMCFSWSKCLILNITSIFCC